MKVAEQGLPWPAAGRRERSSSHVVAQKQRAWGGGGVGDVLGEGGGVLGERWRGGERARRWGGGGGND
jgi:hypothetical protein